ncbi:MAG: class I SAM-dependent methyltransferase, partial [Nitrososphaera sp.]
MHKSSLQYVRCVKCGHKLELESFEYDNEVIEGLLSCVKCDGIYPIISSIPFLIEDLSLFFSIRAKLGGHLLLAVRNSRIKSMIKKSLRGIKKIGDDVTDLEKNWVTIYQKSKPSSFQIKVKHVIKQLPQSDFFLEHGCSIGTMSEVAAKYHGKVFGIDKSFFALLEAKKRKIKDADFFLADSLSRPFGTMKFDVVMALNVLELIEPIKLLKIIKL